MIAASLFLTAALAAQSPGADSLQVLAMHLPESALIVEARARPLVMRDALTEALARSVKGSDEALSSARRLAAAYALAWADSFLVREVERFAEWPVRQRAGKVWVDSVRLGSGVRTRGTPVDRMGGAASARDRPPRPAGLATPRGNIVRALAACSGQRRALPRRARLRPADRRPRVEAHAVGALAT